MATWGSAVFRQFDTDKDGRLSTKELTRALKSLPKSKPKNIPPGTKFMSVDDMIAALDVDGDGSIDETEWLDNLAKCAGLAAALAENVNEAGEVASFRSFEEQKAKREAQVAALREKETRTEEEEAQLVEFARQVESLARKIEEANANALKSFNAPAASASADAIFAKLDTEGAGKLQGEQLTALAEWVAKTFFAEAVVQAAPPPHTHTACCC